MTRLVVGQNVLPGTRPRTTIAIARDHTIIQLIMIIRHAGHSLMIFSTKWTCKGNGHVRSRHHCVGQATLQEPFVDKRLNLTLFRKHKGKKGGLQKRRVQSNAHLQLISMSLNQEMDASGAKQVSLHGLTGNRCVNALGTNRANQVLLKQNGLILFRKDS
jgi:hypothetical protein